MITSMENAQVKHLMRLREKAKYRRECGSYLIEGPRTAREIAPEMLEAVYVSRQFEQAHPEEALKMAGKARNAHARYEQLSDAVFAKISGTVTPQGVLCVVKCRTDTLETLLAGKRPVTLLVLENIQDPGNLGTMLRTGEAAGITGIIADDATVDLYNPKVVRGTMGAVLRVPFVTVKDLNACVETLRDSGVKTAAMTPDARFSYFQADLRGDLAFLIGNEGNGLSEELMRAADFNISIPMEGQTESLNAAVAAALCMYEAKRQRDAAE